MEFDYIIVGAGSAGCLLANRLSANSQTNVCLIEAGPTDWSPFIHIPAGFIKTVTNKKLNWLYDTLPSWGTNGRSIPTPRGKVIGGSSSINGLIFNRGQKMDFDNWAQRGNNGWSYDDLLPHFKSLEKYVPCGTNNKSNDRSLRGNDGEMIVSDLGWRHPLCDAFIKAAVEMGMPINDDYNGENEEGVSYVQRTVSGMRRMSSAKAYLKSAKKRKNLHIITNAHVTNLQFENQRVVGVEYKKSRFDTKGVLVKTANEVILSAGAINSPQILQLAGIGPGDLLKSIGIEVRQELAGVGKNLRDHYATRLTGRVKNTKTINEMSKGPLLVKEIIKYALGRQSILSLGPTLVYCFWHSNELIRNNDLQISFTPASYALGRQAELDTFPGFSIACWGQRPESSGWVKVNSKNPFDKPLIQPNYLSATEDQKILIEGIKISRSLMHSKPLSKYFDHEIYPGKEIHSDEELLNVARDRSNTAYHLVGSCRMAPETDKTSVVDTKLRVRGFENLRVIDASIMPMIPSSNVNAAVLAIAEKAASEILKND
ncbi:MAG: GMC family oxidoreductase N-terminal domain-containing protein [Paracoccaceae bacterium]|nr:GMC family oxidoreductase N-terminal domain-containing protein [Paracoccaceae bacterium]